MRNQHPWLLIILGPIGISIAMVFGSEQIDYRDIKPDNVSIGLMTADTYEFDDGPCSYCHEREREFGDLCDACDLHLVRSGDREGQPRELLAPRKRGRQWL